VSRFILGLALLGLFSPGTLLAATNSDVIDDIALWDFDVYLNDKRVGKHRFTVSELNGVKQVQSEASFKYKILLITAYRYEHSAAERWTDNCLHEFDASTNANGKKTQVSGERTESGFLVANDVSPFEPSDCVMTFAYWNPDFLNQPRLLNPQTGEFVDVEVENDGDEILEVRGQPIIATRFKVKADKVDLTLWYSADSEWLALESVADGGHIIRYELS